MEKLIKGNNGITTICLLMIGYLCWSKVESDNKEAEFRADMIKFQRNVDNHLISIEAGMWASHIPMPPYQPQSSSIKEPSDTVLAQRKETVTTKQ